MDWNKRLTKFLEVEPKARERKNKNKAVAYLIKERYNLDIRSDLLTEIVSDAQTLDRAWRKITLDNPELRGSDYEEKAALVEKAQARLGYSTATQQDPELMRLLF